MKLLLAILLISASSLVQAEGYFASPFYTPYPPGCVTLPSRQEMLYGDNINKFWSGSILLENVRKLQSPAQNFTLVDVDMYRVACAEPNRSVIMVEFSRSDPSFSVVLPTFAGVSNMPMGWVEFDLKPEPNSWGQTSSQQSLTKQTIGDYSGWEGPNTAPFTWRYVLDLPSSGRYWSSSFLADYYNDGMVLQPYVNGAWVDSYIEVPPTADVLKPSSSLPLNGRLSGLWVEEGAADQGFLLTFANPVPPSGSEVSAPESAGMMVFLSWYTFDSHGQQLWLVGNARFPQGETEVSMSLIQVTEGQFLGSKPVDGIGSAPPASVGAISLNALSCNVLELEYDLSSLGLNKGTLKLQRPAELETAGYPCRDYDARLMSLSPAQDR